MSSTLGRLVATSASKPPVGNPLRDATPRDRGSQRRVGSKPSTFRVTIVLTWTSAVAASRASRSGLGSGVCSFAQRRATPASIGRMRPAKVGRTCPSIHARMIAPCAASRRSMRRTPRSSSRTLMADRNVTIEPQAQVAVRELSPPAAELRRGAETLSRVNVADGRGARHHWGAGCRAPWTPPSRTRNRMPNLLSRRGSPP